MPISSPLRSKLRHASSGGEERGEPLDSRREYNPPPAPRIEVSVREFQLLSCSKLSDRIIISVFIVPLQSVDIYDGRKRNIHFSQAI